MDYKIIIIIIIIWNDLVDSVFNGVGLACFKSRVNAFLLAYAALSIFVFHCLHFIILPSVGWLCGVEVVGLIVCIHSLTVLN